MNSTHTSSRLVGAALIAVLPVVASATIQAQSAKGDGIKVHGYWTIDVRNADGGLASHNEFENALEPSGGVALTGLLARNSVPTAWRLDLIGANLTSGPCVKTPFGATGATLTMRLDAAIFNEVTNAWMLPADFDGPEFSFGPFFQESGIQTPQFQKVLTVVGDSEADIVSLQGSGQFGMLPPIPGFQYNYNLGNPGPNQYSSFLSFDLSGVAPGTYQERIVLGDEALHQVNYTVTVTVPDPDPSQATSYPCSAVEPTAVITGDLTNAWFPTLTFALVPAGSGQNLEISGNVTVSSSESITQVRSVLMTSASGPLPFSSRALQTPIQVVPGQKVYVKVAFSFS